MECTPRRRRALTSLGMVCTICMAATMTVSGCVATKPSYVLYDKADHHIDLGQYEEAAACYDEVLLNYPGDWRAQYGLGVCSMEIGDYRTARRALDTARTLRPGNEEIVDALCETMYQQDDEQSLYELLAEECDARQSVRAHLRKAKYMARVADPDSAKVAINTAIAIDAGQTVEPYLEAADFAEEVGDIDLAIRRLRQAYGIAPGDDRVSERLVALGEIPGPTLVLPPGV